MKISFNFYAFLRNFCFYFISLFWLIFPLQKFKKNNNFKAKTSKIHMNNICCQISNKFVDFLDFENGFFNRKTKEKCFFP